MIFTASVSSLSQSLHRWELAEYISEGFVILACAGELVADLGVSWLTEGHKKHLQRRSTILLVAALSVSLICLVRTNELSGSVIGSLGDKAEDADRKAKTALTDSATALSQAKDALTKAADALERANAAELEADKLKNRFSDRILNGDQAKSITANIKPYTGQEFTVVTYWDLREPLALSNRISDVLNRGGWKYVEPNAGTILYPGISGVEVWIHPDASATTKQAARVLASALSKIGIETKIMQQNPKNPFDPKIRLNVGTKE
jgi:hypothetical protein